MRGFAKSKSKRKALRPVQGTLFPGVEDPINVQAGRDIIPLDFETRAVRMRIIRGVEWFHNADVCRCLDLANPSQVAARLDDDEKTTLHTVEGGGNAQGGGSAATWINQAGVFSLILTSRKPEAKRFKRWLVHEVLPALREKGTYTIPGPSDRVRQTMKQLRCDESTAVRRLESRDLNKRLHDEIFARGGGIVHIAELHNAVYRGLTGKKAKELREMVGIKPDATPLDRMSELLLAQSTHAKTLADRINQAANIEPKAQSFVYEETARQIVAQDQGKLPSPHVFGVVDDPHRGKVIDLVPAQIAASKEVAP